MKNENWKIFAIHFGREITMMEVGFFQTEIVDYIIISARSMEKICFLKNEMENGGQWNPNRWP